MTRRLVRVDLAEPHDDPDLRQLLRDNAVPGPISVTFEREPDFFLAADVEGERHQTFVGRDSATGHVAGMGTRSVRAAWVNGRAETIGYLSQLRVAPEFRSRKGPLAAGYAKLRELHDEARDAKMYVTTIIQENQVARRLLEAGLRGFPTYRSVDTLVTLAIPVPLRSRQRLDSRVRRATATDLPRLAEFLQQRYARYQFAPVWTHDLLACPRRCRDLRPEDFLMVEQEGRLVGCLAVWDQSAYKQIVVRGYHPSLSRWRESVNVMGSWLGLPELPQPGQRLPSAFLSHLAGDESRPEIMDALVEAGLQEASRRGIGMLMVGLTKSHPWLTRLRARQRHVAYEAVLYVVYWDEAPSLDHRIPHLEVALL